MSLEEDFGIINFLTDEGRGTDILPEVLKGAENIKALINGVLPEIQQIHDAQSDIYQSINITNAVGVQLDDIFGQILDEPRKTGQSDDEYRLVLRAAVAMRTRAGEIDLIKGVAISLFEVPLLDISLIELFSMQVLLHITVDSLTQITNEEMRVNALRRAKQAGVNLVPIQQLRTSQFVFTDNLAGGDAGKGFATLLDGSDGASFGDILG